MPPSSQAVSDPYAHRVLLNDDLLRIIFSFFHSGREGDRLACASGALVCHAWTEPASRVLWRRMDWWLLPLYNVLMPAPKIGPFDRDVEDQLASYCDEIIQQRPFDDPVIWTSFLRCGARIRDIEIALITDSEIELITLLLEINNGATFLKSLKVMYWTPTTEDFDHSDILLALLPQYLEELNLAVAEDTSRESKEKVLAALPSTTSYLDTLAIDIWNPIILSCTNLREFRLYDLSDALTPTQIRQLASMPSLKFVSITITGFVSLSYFDTVNAPSWEELRCKGSCTDLARFLQTLQAPQLREVILNFSDEDATYGLAHEYLFRLICDMPLVRSLTSVGFFISGGTPSDPLDSLPRASLIDIVEPFLVLGHLQSFEAVVYSSAVSCTDDDILRMARAWPKVRHPMLAHMPGTDLPSPTALSHLAQHCRELRALSMAMKDDLQVVHDQFARMTTASESAPTTTLAADHPLEMLELSTREDLGFVGERVDQIGQLAQLVDRLFPALDIRSCVEQIFPWDQEGSGWTHFWEEVGKLQQARRHRVLQNMNITQSIQ